MAINTYICRPYELTDLEPILSLFYDTVHTINIKDYSAEQIKVWAPDALDKAKWARSLSEYFTFVVEMDEVVIGFGDMTRSGSLEHLYVDKKFQGCGVASLILNAIEEKADELALEVITTESSITAKLFFEKRGFCVIQKREKTVRGMMFIVYDMKKVLGE